MAQRAFAMISQLSVNGGDDTKVDVQVIVCISGADVGEYPSGRVVMTVENVNPVSMTNANVEALVRAELLANGVPFGLLDVDTVRLY